MSSAYDPGMPSEKGMISTDQPDPTLTCLQSILEEQLSLCFVLIDETVPVDPAVEGAGELKDKDSFVPPVYSKPILALAKRPAARAGSHRRPSLGLTCCPLLDATRSSESR